MIALSTTLFTPERASAAAMRHWLREDTSYAAATVLHGRSSERDALHFLITTALAFAERTGIAPDVARSVAVSEFRDAIADGERRCNRVLRIMVDAALGELSAGRSRRIQAANAAADVARAEQAPAHLIEPAMRIALWRLRQQHPRTMHRG